MCTGAGGRREEARDAVYEEHLPAPWRKLIGKGKGSAKRGLARGEPGVGRLRFLFGASLAAVSREQLLLRFTKLR